MKKKLLAALILALVLVGSAYAGGRNETARRGKFLVGFSQGTMNHPIRIAMVEQNVEYARINYPDMEIRWTDGQNNTARQVSDVEDLVAMGIDLLIISPLTEEGLTDAVARVMARGIPVITLDRSVNTEVTSFIGAENFPMGQEAGRWLVRQRGNAATTIIEIHGTAGASATLERSGGFRDIIASQPNMRIVAEQVGDYLREPAMRFMEDMLQRFAPGQIDVVYAHNDEMALGAIAAIQAAGRGNEGIIVIGMDGTEVAFEAIRDGTQALTVVYPYVAPEGVQYAWRLLNGETLPKRILLDTAVVTRENISEWIGRGL